MQRLLLQISAALVMAVAATGCARHPRHPGVGEATSSPVAEPPAPAVRTVALGTSVNGEPITMHVFGDGAEVTLIFCAIHGDETAAAFVGRKLLDECHTMVAELAGASVALVPVANPDGVAAGTRTNANGVDCNRNFPASNWKRRPGFLRSNPGKSPASEPETLAIMKAVELTKPARIVSVHSGLRCNNYDGPAADLAALMASHNGYPVKSSVGYPTPGSFGSWAGIDLGIPVLTLELPRHPDGEKAWAENRAGLLAVIGAGHAVAARTTP